MLLQNAGFQRFALLFQLIHSLFGGWRQDALFNGRNQISDFLFYFLQLFLQKWKPGIFLFLIGQQQIAQTVHHFRLEHFLNSGFYHKKLQWLLANGLQIAGGAAISLVVSTFIVIVDCTRMTFAAFPTDHRAAFAAKRLGRQHKVDLCFCMRRSLFVAFTAALHLLKQFRVNDGRNSVRDDCIFIAVFAQIPAVFQHGLKTAFGKWPAQAGSDATAVKICPNGLDTLPVGIPPEGLLHHRCGGRVELVVLFAVDAVAQRHRAAVELGLECIFLVAAADLLGQVGRIILGHAFQQAFQHDAFRRVGDGFRHRHHMDPVVFKDALIVGRVVPVAGEAVQLPHQHCLKGVGGAVVDHLLELRAAVGLGRKRPVNVRANQVDAVFVGILLALPQLAFDGFLTLVVAAVTGINDGIHGAHLLTCAFPPRPC